MKLSDYWCAMKEAMQHKRMGAFRESLQASAEAETFWSDRRKYIIEHSRPQIQSKAPQVETEAHIDKNTSRAADLPRRRQRGWEMER